MTNKLNKIFDDWLFSEKKDYNPFLKMFKEIGEGLPKVKKPDLPYEEENLMEELEDERFDYHPRPEEV